jgi:hypothetical protein
VVLDSVGMMIAIDNLNEVSRFCLLAKGIMISALRGWEWRGERISPSKIRSHYAMIVPKCSLFLSSKVQICARRSSGLQDVTDRNYAR